MTDLLHPGAFIDALIGQKASVPGDLHKDMLFGLDMSRARPAVAPVAPVIIPPWIHEARLHLGEKEIPGPQNSSFIMGMLKRLGVSWIKDDETPWCGTFVGYCLTMAGVTAIPKNFFRALEWASWGGPAKPVVGAIAVFTRVGGGHVGFVVGESDTNWYILGGNQSNMVCITPIAKSRAPVFRWPADVPMGQAQLPRMTGGTVSGSEQ